MNPKTQDHETILERVTQKALDNAEEADRLREIKAELLAALEESQNALLAMREAGIAEISGSEINGLIASNNRAIVRAEGKDR